MLQSCMPAMAASQCVQPSNPDGDTSNPQCFKFKCRPMLICGMQTYSGFLILQVLCLERRGCEIVKQESPAAPGGAAFLRDISLGCCDEASCSEGVVLQGGCWAASVICTTDFEQTVSAQLIVAARHSMVSDGQQDQCSSSNHTTAPKSNHLEL